MRTSNLAPMPRRSADAGDDRGRDRKRNTSGPRGKRATVARKRARMVKSSAFVVTG